ncbi:hypothetical protein AMJ47_00005, partial [Parcubacteria bacterium DG_72]
MKKNILAILIILVPIIAIGVFVWFVYSDKEESAVDISTRKIISLKVDLGEENLDTQKVLEDSDIKISDPEGKAQEELFDIDLVSAGNGEYELKINPKKQTLRPGKYYVSARFVTDKGV